MARKTDVYREAIVSLHVSIQEALDSIDNQPEIAKAILSAALEYTQIDQLDKDCGCG